MSSQVVESNPIINDPFSEPTRHWAFGAATPQIVDGRRPSGFLPPDPSGQLRIVDVLTELAVVNDLRTRVRDWRQSGYEGATRVTKDLFEHWFDSERRSSGTLPFFCQREAIETIAFLAEAPAHLTVGLSVPSAGEAYERWATKMATGTGKTLVMTLTALWSILNKAANRQDPRFVDQVLVVCPNITVRDRLTGAGGLDPSHPESVYQQFDLVPSHLQPLLGRGRIQVANWHQLAPREDPRRSVVKRGRESDTAFARRVLDGLHPSGKVLVLNDEAHHAYRFPAGVTASRSESDDIREATVWIEGLARIHRARGILRCHDYSATPMYPGSFRDRAWTPFEWIISDFALVDAIESGLVKIPRTPTDDNTGQSIPKYRNLWTHIKSVLPKRTEASDSSHPLTDYLAEADGPLKQLAGAWEETFEEWSSAARPTPPVLIVICHDTTVASLLEKHIAELGEASVELVNPPGGSPVTIRVDTDALAKAEAGLGTTATEEIRRLVATVGREGEPGEKVRCVVSVSMLSEGWDCRNVTHILGLRAFQSQLLCEQVVGRGLRRSDYSDLSQPEFVDVYGVPFQLLPIARATGGRPVPPPDYQQVHTVADRHELRIRFPRVVQVVPEVDDVLDVDWPAVEPIRVEPRFDPTETWVELDLGSPKDGMGGETQDRERAYEAFRLQRLWFRIAARLISPFGKPWLFPQAVEIAQRAVRPVSQGGCVVYGAGVDEREVCNLRYLTLIHERLAAALRPSAGDERLLPALDEYLPIGSTDGLNFSAPRDRCVEARRSHLSHAVCDSGLEKRMVEVLDRHPAVIAWVKNHRLFLEVPYLFFGKPHRYRPDFVVRLTNGLSLLLEAKGEADERDDAKKTAARRWGVAVTTWGELGPWSYEICFDERDLPGLLDARARELAPL